MDDSRETSCLVGRGDPNLSGRALPYALRTERSDHPIEVLEQLADSLVQKGVKYIDGDIVADDSYFAFERYGEGWSQDDLVWADGAPVSALTINDNVVFVNILPADRAGERAFVSLTPVCRLLPHRQSNHHDSSGNAAKDFDEPRAWLDRVDAVGQHAVGGSWGERCISD